MGLTIICSWSKSSAQHPVFIFSNVGVKFAPHFMKMHNMFVLTLAMFVQVRLSEDLAVIRIDFQNKCSNSAHNRLLEVGR